MACPLTMSSRTVIRSTARPGATSTISMPRAWLARSPAHIAAAERSATTSGVSTSGLQRAGEQLLEHAVVPLGRFLVVGRGVVHGVAVGRPGVDVVDEHQARGGQC